MLSRLMRRVWSGSTCPLASETRDGHFLKHVSKGSARGIKRRLTKKWKMSTTNPEMCFLMIPMEDGKSCATLMVTLTNLPSLESLVLQDQVNPLSSTASLVARTVRVVQKEKSIISAIKITCA
jgi:hypothetical protein